VRHDEFLELVVVMSLFLLAAVPGRLYLYDVDDAARFDVRFDVCSPFSLRLP
jgi:hypothetical protein